MGRKFAFDSRFWRFTLLSSIFIVVAGCGGAGTSANLVGNPPAQIAAGRGRIFVLGMPRAFNIASGIVPVSVFDGERPIGTMKGRQFLWWDRAPGTADVFSKAGNVAGVQIVVEPGKNHYILQHISPAGWTPDSPMKTTLEMVGPDRGIAELKKSKPGESAASIASDAK